MTIHVWFLDPALETGECDDVTIYLPSTDPEDQLEVRLSTDAGLAFNEACTNRRHVWSVGLVGRSSYSQEFPVYACPTSTGKGTLTAEVYLGNEFVKGNSDSATIVPPPTNTPRPTSAPPARPTQTPPEIDDLWDVDMKKHGDCLYVSLREDSSDKIEARVIGGTNYFAASTIYQGIPDGFMFSPPTLLELGNPKPSYSFISLSSILDTCTFGASAHIVKPSFLANTDLTGIFSIQSHIGKVEYSNPDSAICRNSDNGMRCVIYSGVVGISFKSKSKDCEHIAQMQGTHDFPSTRLKLTTSAAVHFKWFEFLGPICDTRISVN